jgi:hypothetical protein
MQFLLRDRRTPVVSGRVTAGVYVVITDAPESYAEKLSRIQAMADDDGDQWDLSKNDKAALIEVLVRIETLEQALREALRIVLEGSTVEDVLRDALGASK